MPFVGHRGLSGGQAFSTFQWELVLFALVATGFALLASFVYALSTKSEVSKKYRPSTLANALISIVAALSYLLLVVYWNLGFHYDGTKFVPSSSHFFGTSLRYTDWTITVPLLVVEFLAVAGVTGRAATRLRGPMMASAAAMTVAGFIGQALNEDAHTNLAAFAIWGAVSTVFFLALYPMFGVALKASREAMGPDAYKNLSGATGLLLATFVVYPAVYVIFGLFRVSIAWAVATQLIFCCADVTAKVGFGAWIHKVAKLRTAEDTARGELAISDEYPQEVFVDQIRLSAPGVDNLLVNGGAPSRR